MYVCEKKKVKNNPHGTEATQSQSSGNVRKKVGKKRKRKREKLREEYPGLDVTAEEKDPFPSPKKKESNNLLREKNQTKPIDKCPLAIRSLL